MTELDSDPFLQDLVERLALCSSLEEGTPGSRGISKPFHDKDG